MEITLNTLWTEINFLCLCTSICVICNIFISSNSFYKVKLSLSVHKGIQREQRYNATYSSVLDIVERSTPCLGTLPPEKEPHDQFNMLLGGPTVVLDILEGRRISCSC